MEQTDKIKKQNFLKKLRYYQGRYFVGMEINGKTKFLHYNKKGYELRNGLSLKAVILKYDNADDNKRFETLASSPFKHCYKIDCNEHLYGYRPKQPFWKLLIEYLRKLWTNQ